jgi:hypothetical protein
MLYQPTPNEITAAKARAALRNPYLGSRLEKACQILDNINAHFDCGEVWSIRSQSDPNEWYTINATRQTSGVDVAAGACTCPDYAKHAPLTKRYFCKHLLAYYGYHRLLSNALHRRLVGDFRWSNDRQYSRICPGSLLTAIDPLPRILAYDAWKMFPRHVCNVRLNNEEKFVPKSDPDYAALSEWLATAPAFSVRPEQPRLEDYIPDTFASLSTSQAEWQPSVTPPEYNHWIATGEPPATRSHFLPAQGQP